MAMADITIRGAGIFGLTIAWEAVRRGARVRVIDPGGPGAGASGGVVGALQPHTPDVWNPKKQFQLESLLLARELWPGVEAASGLSTGYAQAGRLQPLRGERDVVLARARQEAAQQRWGDAATWRVIETDDTGPWRPPSASGLYIHDTLSALIHPAQAVKSLARALEVSGVPILTDGTDQGRVIWATGWQGLLDLNAALDRNVGAGVKGQAAVLRHNAAGSPQIYAESLHIVPHTNGTVAIGSTSESQFDYPTGTDALLDDIVTRARTILPALANADVIARWAGVRPRAKSRAPLLGPWPDRPGHYVANGGFKIGFGMAPKVAVTICDLVLDDRVTYPEDFAL